MERVAKITLNCFDGGTIGVMSYADAHPDECFDNTEVYVKYSDGHECYFFMVSEYNWSKSEKTAEELGTIQFHDLPNGWQRESSCLGAWVCRKNGRYIIITT